MHLQSTTNEMQRFSIYLVHKMLYMFQAVPPPIIRSTKLYIQLQLFVRPMVLTAAIMEDLFSLMMLNIRNVAGNVMYNIVHSIVII